MITKSEFIDWKNNHVTKTVMAGLQERADFMKEQLATTAGANPQEDRYRTGYIAAVRDLLLIEYEGEDK